MECGDFTELAGYYIHRPAYSKVMLKAVLKYIDYDRRPEFKIADVGAGTGKLTRMLLEAGLSVVAVEPNDSMRKEGVDYTQGFKVDWIKGSGEKTTLGDKSIDWVVMASSFHWTDPKISLPEFHRILKSDGFLTVMWNPRNIEKSELHAKIEDKIYKIVPDMKRVSSGSKNHAKQWEEILVSTGHFKDVIFMETCYTEIMSKERYMGVWKSVNDIRAQAGPEKWKDILEAIEIEIEGMNVIEVPYKIRAWTAQKTG